VSELAIMYNVEQKEKEKSISIMYIILFPNINILVLRSYIHAVYVESAATLSSMGSE
jgi:hypothetical protein